VGFGPSNRLLRASSAFEFFEPRLRSLESSSSDQQCRRIIRAWASVPRIVFFGPAVPSNYSSLGFGPSNCLLRASSAFELFEPGLRPLELSSSLQQCPRIIWARASVPRIISFESANISALFEFGPRSLESLFRAINTFRAKYPNFGGNIPVRIPYVKYEGKSTVCKTRWPGIRIKHALPRNFPYLRYEVCTDGRIGCLTMNWASTW
jgi:hypothetical protein